MRGELVHLLLFVAVCLTAYLRGNLPDFEERDVYLRGKVVGDVLWEGNYIQTKVAVKESEIEEIEGREALLKIYGYVPSEIEEFSLIGNVKVRGNRLFISAKSEDVELLKPKEGVREFLVERYRRTSTDKSAVPLGLSFLFGQSRDLLPSQVQGSFLKTGLVHLLVISGLHVGSIAFILSKLLPRFWGLRLALVGIVLYSLFVVPNNPPVLRASIMFSLFILLSLSFRRPNSLAILLFSGSVILLFYPYYLFSYSFWLSFMATAYIILVLRSFSGGRFKKTFAVSLSAFTGTAPLVSTFSYVSPLSVLLTPVLAPVVLAYSFFGVLSLLTLMSFPPFVDLFNLIGKIFQGAVSFADAFSFQLYPRISFSEACLLTSAGLFSLYFLRGERGLIALLLINGWLLLRAFF